MPSQNINTKVVPLIKIIKNNMSNLAREVHHELYSNNVNEDVKLHIIDATQQKYSSSQNILNNYESVSATELYSSSNEEPRIEEKDLVAKLFSFYDYIFSLNLQVQHEAQEAFKVFPVQKEIELTNLNNIKKTTKKYLLLFDEKELTAQENNPSKFFQQLKSQYDSLSIDNKNFLANILLDLKNIHNASTIKVIDSSKSTELVNSNIINEDNINEKKFGNLTFDVDNIASNSELSNVWNQKMNKVLDSLEEFVTKTQNPIAENRWDSATEKLQLLN